MDPLCQSHSSMRRCGFRHPGTDPPLATTAAVMCGAEHCHLPPQSYPLASVSSATIARAHSSTFEPLHHPQPCDENHQEDACRKLMEIAPPHHPNSPFFQDGSSHTVEGAIGMSVLRVAHAHGIDLEGACEASVRALPEPNIPLTKPHSISWTPVCCLFSLPHALEWPILDFPGNLRPWVHFLKPRSLHALLATSCWRSPFTNPSKNPPTTRMTCSTWHLRSPTLAGWVAR